MFAHLAGENQTEQDGYGELAVAEEDDVEQVRVGRVLQEEPENKGHIVLHVPLGDPYQSTACPIPWELTMTCMQLIGLDTLVRARYF